MSIKNFKRLYEECHKNLSSALDCKNMHQVPKLLKVSLNMCVGSSAQGSKAVQNAMNDMALICGQKPIPTLAKKSIAGFSVRKGMKIDCKVTLRRNRMYEFLERFVMIALPRVKDFKGFSMKNFDGKGNCNFGIPEQIVFPEIDYDKIDTIRGLNITIVTSAKNDLQARKLLEIFYLPFYD